MKISDASPFAKVMIHILGFAFFVVLILAIITTVFPRSTEESTQNINPVETSGQYITMTSQFELIPSDDEQWLQIKDELSLSHEVRNVTGSELNYGANLYAQPIGEHYTSGHVAIPRNIEIGQDITEMFDVNFSLTNDLLQTEATLKPDMNFSPTTFAPGFYVLVLQTTVR